MASLADLQSLYTPSQPAGFSLAEFGLAGNLGNTEAQVGRERILRNYNKFELPSVLGAQAARGAFGSSATERKKQALATSSADQLGDIQFALARQQANLAANSLLAQTGIRLGAV